MTSLLIVGAAVIVVLLVVAVVALRHRTGRDTVAAFQRHIDALGPTARRPTVDKVQELDEERRSVDPEGDSDGA